MSPIIFFSLTLCQYISVINQKIFIQQADSIWEVQKNVFILMIFTFYRD